MSFLTPVYVQEAWKVGGVLRSVQSQCGLDLAGLCPIQSKGAHLSEVGPCEVTAPVEGTWSASHPSQASRSEQVWKMGSRARNCVGRGAVAAAESEGVNHTRVTLPHLSAY